MEEMRECCKCGISRTLDRFVRSSKAPGGLLNRCKNCDNLRRSSKVKERFLKGEGTNIPTKLSQELAAQGLKRCPTCREIKNAEAAFYKNASRGYDYHCMVCAAKRAQGDAAKESRNKTRKGKEKKRHSNHLKYKFEMTIEEYEAKVLEQDGLCKICNNPQPLNRYYGKLCVDHNHETDKIRGLLCANCNSAIGFAKEDVNILQNIIKYLESYKE